MEKLLRIGVIRGGISTEREVSLNTGSEIIKHLNKEKYEVFDIIIDKKEDAFYKIKDLKLDFAYIALHGQFGEDGKIQAILESLNVSYCGSGVMSSALCMDKDLTKTVSATKGVRTAKWLTVKQNNKISWEEISEKLGNSVVVKPNHGGSSVGVSFVNNAEELKKALNLVYETDNEAIIEMPIIGTEVSVPVIGGEVFPTLMIEALAGTFFDYASKYQDGGAKEYVHFFDDKLQNELNNFAKITYESVKCDGFARIDFLIRDNQAYMMEVNTLPGMTGASLLPKSTAYKGYSYSETLDLLIDVSMKIKR